MTPDKQMIERVARAIGKADHAHENWWKQYERHAQAALSAITPPNGDEVREALERVRNGLRAYLPNSHVSTPVSIQRLVEICDAALAKEKLG